MSTAFQSLWASVVRTVTPIIVGSVVAFFVNAGITLDQEFSVLLENALVLVFTGVYYTAARLLETYVTPKFGWLLLFPKAPTGYSKDGVSGTPNVG